MNSSKELFNKGMDKAFSQINLNSETMKDLTKYKSEFKENNKPFNKQKESLEGGVGDNKTFEDLVKTNTRKGKDISQVEKELKIQLNKGIRVEMEHTKNRKIAKEIAMDHLFEDPKYYDKLKKIENKEATGSGSSGSYSAPLFSGEEPKKVEAKEATGSGSVGAYETPAAWAKSTSKKDWRGKSKTQIPGGSFVSIKKKCKTFPYCNQGDIKALNLYEKESVKEAIKNVAEKLNLNENVIKSILQYELEMKHKH
jgi:hypothetical protein